MTLYAFVKEKTAVKVYMFSLDSNTINIT